MKKKNLVLPAIIGSTALIVSLKWAADKVSHAGSISKSISTDEPYSEIDDYIEAQMKRLNIPAAMLAIVAGDRIVHTRGFGQAQTGGEVPNPRTPFFIGSLTKAITALAVMQLVEAGKLELDSPVVRYLPWFVTGNRQEISPEYDFITETPIYERIKVRHLLNQTSGLPIGAGMSTLANISDGSDAIESISRVLKTVVIKHQPGENCEYCNLNYDLLGLIIEAVSGEKYADFIQKHIFDPLGMQHSYTSKQIAAQNHLATGHRYWFGIPVPAPDLPVPVNSIASGQLISCAEDMARFLIAHLNDGRCGDVQILSKPGVEVLHQGVKELIMMGTSSGPYAMGWLVDETLGTKMLLHGGNVPDFSAHMGLLPDQKKGLVLLINSDHYGLPPILGEVGKGATALLAGKQPDPIRLGFIPWAMRVLPVIILLQILGLIGTLGKMQSWTKNPELFPGRGKMIRQHLLAEVPNLAIASLPIFLASKKMLGYLRYFMPDVFWTALVSGGFAGLWAALRTGLVARFLRRNS